MGDPYQISTCLQLQEATSSLSSNFILNNDIDCSDTVNWNAGAGFSPIGATSGSRFTGTFNGNGHKVVDLYINRPATSGIGLFGYTSITANIYRIGILNGNFTGASSVGGLVGSNVGTTSESYAIANVTTTVNNAGGSAGGLLGDNVGPVANCYARGTVNGGASSPIAGLTAYNLSPARVTNSYAASVINGLNQGTGFISTQSALPTNSFWDVTISGKSGSNGGTGTTTLALNTATTFSAWDMTNMWAIDENRNNGYPYLRNNDPGVDTVRQVATVTDLQNIYLHPGDRFIQTADIDATSTLTWNAGAGFDPIDLFYGKYEGNGFIITNLTINRPSEDYVGVFGQNRGTINNFKIADSIFSGRSYTGSVVGYNGGILYRSKLYRLNNSSSAVTGYSNVGGLTGYNASGATLSQSYAVSNVTTTFNNNGALAGGLVGTNVGNVYNCYARGSVNGGALSGIAGLIATNVSPAVVVNSFAASVITGAVGTGFIYSSSAVDPVNSFWDLNVSGKSSSWGIGASTSVMKTLSTFTNVGWDFNGSIWHMDPLGLKDDGYPYLNPPVLPNLEIRTVTDLQNIASSPDRNYIQMSDVDGSASASWNSGSGFAPIVNFTGNYNGNGFNVTNLTINRPTEDYVGIFAQNRGVISGLKIAGSNFTGRTYVGSVAGYNQGTIYRSGAFTVNNSSNQVTGYSNIGGLAGYNSSVGTISQSSASSSVTTTLNSGGASAGGFVGYNQGTISNCYARGSVSGGNSSGIAGLIGANISPALVSNSFAASTITGTTGAGLIYSQSALPTNSFWDTTASGKALSAGGTGTTTEGMKTASTFTNAGWDFSTVWGLRPEENAGYPYILANAPNYFSLIISYVGQGSTTVNSAPYLAPLSFASGASASLLATARSGWTFANWEDDSKNASRTITIDGDKNLVATFSENVATSSSTSTPIVQGSHSSGYTSVSRLTQTLPTSKGKIIFFTKNLSLYSVDPEVKRLQQYLNNHGFVVAKTGPGSLGQETNKFGALTKKALIKFQETYAKEILKPLGLKKGTGTFGKATRDKINQTLAR